MEDSSTKLLVLLFGDPLGGKGAEGGKGGGTSPDSVLSAGVGDDSDLGGGWEHLAELVVESCGKTFEHGGTTREDDVLGKVLSDIEIGGLDGVVGELLHGVASHTVDAWLEDELWSLESDDSLDNEGGLIWQDVVGVVGGGAGSFFDELVVLGSGLSDETELFLNLLDNLQLR